jgi:hypothetical protein
MATKSKSPGGGGANSRQHVKPTVRGGPPSTKRIDPGKVSMIGLKQGDHGTDGKTTKRPAQPLVQKVVPRVEMGNANALTIGKGGPGAGRVISRSGSQTQYGPARQPEGGLATTPAPFPGFGKGKS